MAAAQALREVRRDDRSSLGRHCGLLPAGEQGLARLRRGAQQQDPRDPTPRLRLAQRRLSAAQNPELHSACPVAVSASPTSIAMPAAGISAGYGLVTNPKPDRPASLWT